MFGDLGPRTKESGNRSEPRRARVHTRPRSGGRHPAEGDNPCTGGPCPSAQSSESGGVFGPPRIDRVRCKHGGEADIVERVIAGGRRRTMYRPTKRVPVAQALPHGCRASGSWVAAQLHPRDAVLSPVPKLDMRRSSGCNCRCGCVEGEQDRDFKRSTSLAQRTEARRFDQLTGAAARRTQKHCKTSFQRPGVTPTCEQVKVGLAPGRGDREQLDRHCLLDQAAQGA